MAPASDMGGNGGGSGVRSMGVEEREEGEARERGWVYGGGGGTGLQRRICGGRREGGREGEREGGWV